MPIYEYICPDCGDEKEILQKLKDNSPFCDKCQAEMKKVMSISAFSLKGDCWATDGYSFKKPSKEGK